jgi:hypothetical protein
MRLLILYHMLSLAWTDVRLFCGDDEFVAAVKLVDFPLDLAMVSFILLDTDI